VVRDASGKEWPVRKTPINLRHLPEEQRHYQPGAEGAPSPDEILAIPLHEFFETFGSLDQVFHVDQEALQGGRRRAGWFAGRRWGRT
jgi:hypothetical protein